MKGAGPAADRHGRRPLRAQPVAGQSWPRGRAQPGQELSRRLRRVLGNRPVRPAAPRSRGRGRAQPGAGRRSGAGPHRGRRRGGAQLLELRGAEQRLAVARANLRSQEDSLRVIQAMVSAGRGDEGDLASARAELATVQASVPQQAAARRLAQYRIAVLAGLRPPNWENWTRRGAGAAGGPPADRRRRRAAVAATRRAGGRAQHGRRQCRRGRGDRRAVSAHRPGRLPRFRGAARRRLRQCLQPRLQRVARRQLAGAAPAHGAGAQARGPGPLRGARSRVTSRPCCARWRSWRPP